MTYTILGDSISIGYSEYIEKYMPSDFVFLRKSASREAYKNLDIPVGANCGDSRMLLDYLRESEKQNLLKSDFYTINAGLHDIKVYPGCKQQVVIEDYIDNLNNIFKLMRDNEKSFCFVTTTNVVDEIHNTPCKEFDRFKHDLDLYNKNAIEICKQQNIKIIDLYSFTLQFGNEAFCDKVHYTDEVKEKQAEFMANSILNFI